MATHGKFSSALKLSRMWPYKGIWRGWWRAKGTLPEIPPLTIPLFENVASLLCCQANEYKVVLKLFNKFI